MTTAYTSLLGFALPVTGELSGTWGDTVNNGITSLLDSAIAGTTTLSADSDVTLTTTQGSSNTAREAILLWTAGGSATRTITAPAQSKIYTVINASSGTQSIILAGAGPTSGVTIAKGESALVAWNGSDFIKISNTAGPGTFTDLTVTGNTTLGNAVSDTITVNSQFVTGTVLRSAQALTNTLALAAYDVDGAAYTNLITLTASNTPTLALTSTGVGTINNMSIGATTASTGAFTTLSANSTVTLSGGTINGVAYLNGSNVLTTGSALTFDGSKLTVSSSVEQFKLLSSGDFSSTGTGYLRFYDSVGAKGYLGYAGTASQMDLQSGLGMNLNLNGAGGVTTFATSNTERMRLTDTSLYTASGINVSIGSTSTIYLSRFSVAYDGNAQNGPTFADNRTFAINRGGSVYLAGQYNTAGNYRPFGGLKAGKENATDGNSAGYLSFSTNDNGADTTERMRLDSSGNLGLGVTPSAWNSSWAAFQLGNRSLARSNAGAGDLTMVFNGYFDSTDSRWEFQNSGDYAARYSITGAGVHSWHTSTGTGANANDPITFTQAMTLDADGDLGIGQTSPAFKLDVQVAVGNAIAVRPSTATGNAKQSALRLYGSDSVTASRYAEVACFNDTAGSDTNALTFSTGYGATIYERARISSDGNFIIGSTNAQLQLDATTNNGNISVISSAANANLNLASKGAGSINFNATGGFYCTQIYSTAVGGTNRAVYSDNTGTIGYLSSVRASKINIENITNASWLMQLNPVKFNYRKKDEDGNYTEEFDNTIEYGLIAEEAEIIKQELCFYDEVDGTQVLRGVNYQKLVVPMLKAIQEQQALITQLTARITALEGA